MIPKKLIETLTDDEKIEILNKGVVGGVFKKISEEETSFKEQFDWNNICIQYYFSRSGQKYVVPSYVYLLEKLGSVDIFAVMLLNKYRDKWDRIFIDLTQQYEILADNEYTDTENITDSTTGTSTRENTTADTGTVTDSKLETASVWAYNSAEAIPSEKAVSSDTNTRDTQSKVNGSDEHFENFIRSKTFTHKGRNKPSSEILQSDIDFYVNNVFLETMLADIDEMLCLQIFN